ncbi:MAG: NADH-quinone oxidoreductase subunit M [Arsenophonus sp. ET-YP4-MAG3]
MLLLWLIFLPFIGGILCWQSERFNKQLPRYLALFLVGLTLLLSIKLWLYGDYSLTNTLVLPQNKVNFFIPWIIPLGINIFLAVDGLSLIMIVLTGIMGIFSILSSWSENQHNQGAYYFHLMWILSGVIGIFMALDLFLFFFFWEMMLIPMYFLIINWGHKDSKKNLRVNTATKFFIYTQGSGLIMLLSIITLALIHYQTLGNWSFSYYDLLNTKMSLQTQYLLMLGFFIAFAVKMPLVPFHGWLADTQEQSPTAGSLDISGIMIKTAAYGLLRFTLPLFPEASIQFTPIAMMLGIISIFYGALLAFKQTDIKRLVAYSNLSHMGFIVIAIYAGSILSYQGAILQMITNSISGAALIIISGQLYERIGTRDMRMMGGLWKKIRWLPALSLFFVVATLGMPGTGNFIGEFIILFGTFEKFKLVTIIMIFSLIFTSIYALWMMQQIYYGVEKSKKTLQPLNYREIFILLTLALLSLILGFYPQPVLDTSKNVMKLLYSLYSIHL